MPKNTSQLASIFQQVAKTLVENQQVLNQTDDVNQDHGDNMVKTFQTIANSLQEKKGSSDSAALAYAAKQLSKSTSSGSGQLYAKGLTQAAAQIKGKNLTPETGMQLLQALIGGGQAPSQVSQPAGGDLLGTILGGLSGGLQTAPAQQTPSASQGGDMLGALLGGLSGGNAGGNAENSGLDMGDLLNAGMAFIQTRQSGGSNVDALMQAFMAGSGMGGSAHRSQSTQLVVSSFLNALGTAVK